MFLVRFGLLLKHLLLHIRQKCLLVRRNGQLLESFGDSVLGGPESSLALDAKLVAKLARIVPVGSHTDTLK